LADTLKTGIGVYFRTDLYSAQSPSMENRVLDGLDDCDVYDGLDEFDVRGVHNGFLMTSDFHDDLVDCDVCSVRDDCDVRGD
jgi:hypothetical protein